MGFLPSTVAPENGWLEDDPFLMRWQNFRGKFLSPLLKKQALLFSEGGEAFSWVPWSHVKQRFCTERTDRDFFTRFFLFVEELAPPGGTNWKLVLQDDIQVLPIWEF